MILITGGAGVMGRRLTRRFLALGEKVRVLTLPGDKEGAKLAQEGVEVWYGDVSNPATLKGVADGVHTVYHLAAILLSPLKPDRFHTVNTLGTAHLLAECERSHVPHFIYISSASVVYPHTNAYARSKREAEALVASSSTLHWTIVRPTLAYEQGGAEEFNHFVHYLRRFPVVPFIGSGNALKSPVFVEDLVQGFVALYGNPKSYGKWYNFSGGDALTLREMAEQILKKMGTPKRIVSLPVWVCRLLSLGAMGIARCTKRPPLLTWQTITGMLYDASLDSKEARQDLGYAPRRFAEGLSQITLLP